MISNKYQSERNGGTTYLLLGKVLAIESISWSTDSVEFLFKASHVTVHKCQAEVEDLVRWRSTNLSEAIRNLRSLLMQNEVAEQRRGRGSGDERSEDKVGELGGQHCEAAELGASSLPRDK